VVVYTYNPVTSKVEAGELKVCGKAEKKGSMTLSQKQNRLGA
jgi:hypothetical protein